MDSKGLKLLFALLVIPMIALSQGVAFRKADTALVTSDNGQFRIFKSQPYYNSLLALKVRYTDTTTKIATRSFASLTYEPKFPTLSVSKGGTGRSTITSGALLKGNATGAIQDAISGTDYVIPFGLSPYALKSYVDSIGALKLNISSILTIVAPLDFPNVLANQNSTLTITVTGSAIGDVVAIGLPNSILTTLTPYNCSFQCWVSATNTVSIRFQNLDPASAHDLASGSFTIKVFK